MDLSLILPMCIKWKKNAILLRLMFRYYTIANILSRTAMLIALKWIRGGIKSVAMERMLQMNITRMSYFSS